MLSQRQRNVSIGAALAVAIAAPAEGLRHYVYMDPVGIPTYCFGETRGAVPGMYYSTEECKRLLNLHIVEAVEVVERCVPNAPPSVLGAFGSAVYNMGPTIACDVKASTAARFLKERNWLQACDQLSRWTKARVAGVLVELPGLVKRRAVERKACLEGVS